MTDYSVYKMKWFEWLLYYIIAFLAVYTTGYIFYRSAYAVVPAALAAFFYPGIRSKAIVERRRRELNMQFKDMLYSLSASLDAGKPAEMAFLQLPADLSILYPDNEAMIIKEAMLIARRIEMHQPAAAALEDFAIRSGVEDIISFSQVFSTCKRAGASIKEIIANATGILNDRMNAREQIYLMLVQRRLEQKILGIMPVAMVFMLTRSAPEYMSPVFDKFAGRIAMTVSLLLIGAACYISQKIVDIKV